MMSEPAPLLHVQSRVRSAVPASAECDATASRRCDCGGTLRQVGTENSLHFDLGPAGWRVIRSLRPVLRCEDCGKAPEPCYPRVSASSAALAHMLVARYQQHQPLYRQAEIMAEQGSSVKRTILADWNAEACARLAPIAEEIRVQGLRAPILNAANVPVGDGRNDNGRLWAYVADPRDWCGDAPPLAWYRFTLDRSGAHVMNELASYRGIVQAPPHEGYERLWARQDAQEVGCWSAIRRRVRDMHRQRPYPLLANLIAQIDRLIDAEEAHRGCEPNRRIAQRQVLATSLLDEIRATIEEGRKELPARRPAANLMAEILDRWPALSRLLEDGQVAVDNRLAEQALRPFAAGRSGWLFGGSRNAGHRAATIYTLIETCKLNGMEPRAYLGGALSGLMREEPASPVELTPWAMGCQ